jgi:hypothetical protein
MYEFIVVKPAGITLRLPLWDACIPAQSESVRAAVLDKKNTHTHCERGRERERERGAREKEREMELAQSSEFACIFQDIVFERASAALFYYSARATYVARRPIKNLAPRCESALVGESAAANSSSAALANWVNFAGE